MWHGRPAHVSALILGGCGKGKPSDESVAKKAGSKVGETLPNVASGVGKGIDKQMTVKVELSDELASQGVTKTVAKSLGIDPKGKGIAVYLMTKGPLVGTLVAKAMTGEGAEIGRAVAEVEFSGDDAKYVSFEFEDEMDTRLVDRYWIDLKT